MDSYLVELDKPLVLWHALFDEYGIEILHVRQANQFVDSGIISDIALQVGVCFPPLLCCHAEHGHVQDISFVAPELLPSE